MRCPTCNDPYAYCITTRWDDKTHEKFETCDRCGGGGAGVPDVYFRHPEFVEHLAHENDESTWDKGTFVTSKKHKAEVMQKLGVREAGDRVHGARIDTTRRIYLT